MSAPTREEMLEFIDDLIKMPEWDWNEDSIEILKSIRRLIEMGPRVTRESLETCVNRLSYWSKNEKGMSEKFVRNRILDLLLEASIEIEGEKKEA